ncbi:GNAT family N-acetyltransferase [Celeribacter indicus]|uniref:N-acetyltransferase GCN5 n=1 Tax=Celeribacter indicus TaxID=1208324 RepID=A0A0B5E4N3_9RHOB|nr:GNAT family N-acetyltransferase [Celeribacter indicus]AJE48001.1 N-acetyltransferase GCN5 [Celeribacter indicus]SDW29101.1 Acetyltransferase (GNAT) family protein [Celeribacter indicus]
MTVTISPLPRDALDRVAGFSLPPEQAQFSGLPARTMDDAPPDRDGHVIEEDGTPVGFFAIDRGYATAHEFAEAGALGLRMFLIDRRAQGRGIASAACRQLAGYLARAYPDRALCYLTVNCRNPHARRAYLNGGFTDTGALYHGGAIGPQHILRLALR